MKVSRVVFRWGAWVLVSLSLALAGCAAPTPKTARNAPSPTASAKDLPTALLTAPTLTTPIPSATHATVASTRSELLTPTPLSTFTSVAKVTPELTPSAEEPTAGPSAVAPEPAAPTATATLTSPQPTALSPAQAPAVGPDSPRVYEFELTIPTYDYEAGFVETQATDPIYAYPRLDFSRVGPPTPRTYRALGLENGYVSLTILPELGGRIYGWIDKATGRQLLYQNPVVKPTQWGYRGWWLAAGGIEWAFPVDEHGLNEWRPWRISTRTTTQGLSVTVSDVETRTGMEVGVTISLDSDHAYVTLQPWARNDTAQAHPYQLWLNAMLTLGGNSVSGETEFIIPAGQVLVHSTGDGGLPGAGEGMAWPLHGGRDMSRYRNWVGHLGFFAPSLSAGFVGVYDHAADQGMVRAFTPGWPAGTKFFGPAGLSPTLWTDDGSHYVELWSGATASFWDYATLNPGEGVGWTERWYPVNGLGGFNMANEAAVLRLVDTGGGAEVGVAVSALTMGELALWAGEQRVASWGLTLYPGQAFRASWTRPPEMAGTLGLSLMLPSGQVIAQTGQVP